VKILDPTIDQEAVDPLADLKLRVDVFQYERELAEKCTGMSRVVRAIESGSIASRHSPNPMQRVVHVLGSWEDLSNIGIKEHDVAAGAVPLVVLAPHCTREIILRTHLVAI
jgi:hypothetical protein